MSSPKSKSGSPGLQVGVGDEDKKQFSANGDSFGGRDQENCSQRSKRGSSSDRKSGSKSRSSGEWRSDDSQSRRRPSRDEDEGPRSRSGSVTGGGDKGLGRSHETKNGSRDRDRSHENGNGSRDRDRSRENGNGCGRDGDRESGGRTYYYNNSNNSAKRYNNNNNNNRGYYNYNNNNRNGGRAWNNNNYNNMGRYGNRDNRYNQNQNYNRYNNYNRGRGNSGNYSNRQQANGDNQQYHKSYYDRDDIKSYRQEKCKSPTDDVENSKNLGVDAINEVEPKSPLLPPPPSPKPVEFTRKLKKPIRESKLNIEGKLMADKKKKRKQKKSYSSSSSSSSSDSSSSSSSSSSSDSDDSDSSDTSSSSSSSITSSENLLGKEKNKRKRSKKNSKKKRKLSSRSKKAIRKKAEKKLRKARKLKKKLKAEKRKMMREAVANHVNSDFDLFGLKSASALPFNGNNIPSPSMTPAAIAKRKDILMSLDEPKIGASQKKKIRMDDDQLTEELKMLRSQLKPVTKEEYEAKMKTIRRVFDKESGRHRLIRGEGEIIEEPVSRERQKEINRNATKADGDYFADRTLLKRKY